MLEHQFIQFGDIPEIPSCDMPLPIGDGTNTTFFAKVAHENGGSNKTTIDIVKPDGELIKANAIQLYPLYKNGALSMYAKAEMKDISDVRPGACFRLRCNMHGFDKIQECSAQDTEIPTASITAGITYQEHLVPYIIAPSDRFTLNIENFRVFYYGSNGVPYNNELITTIIIRGEDEDEIYATSDYISGGGKDIAISVTANKGTTLHIIAAYRLNTAINSDKIIIHHSGIDSLYNEYMEESYSNLLQRVQPHKYAMVTYYCDEDAFGFPFSHKLNGGVPCVLSQMLPIILRKPQLKQNDKVYETLTGKRIVIYATINKEYEAQTEYIHEDWHEKNVIALCCDHISIDGESLVRSESYEVNWDEYTETECGTKLAMATFKMQANINQRNSNHG